MKVDWKPIKEAPKNYVDSVHGPWIFAKNEWGEYAVVRWTIEYPATEGAWMFAYEPDDYINGIQKFDAIEWDYLPEN